MIGCLFVRDVRFFPADAVADPPPQFARNIVQGKSYDMADPAVAGYFADVLQLTLGAAVELDFSQPWHRPGRCSATRGWRRTGSANSPSRRSSWTPTTGAAPSAARTSRRSCRRPTSGPVAKGGEHRLDNGLLLRSDIHTLFDRGYLGVDPQHRLLVSPRLRADFSNGDQFYAKAGQVIDLPERRADRPGREFLEWHLDEVFLKAAAT